MSDLYAPTQFGFLSPSEKSRMTTPNWLRIRSCRRLPEWAAAVEEDGRIVMIFDLRNGETWDMTTEPEHVRHAADVLFGTACNDNDNQDEDPT